MNLQIVLAGLLAALAVGELVRSSLRTPARLEDRVEPYSDRVRARMGTTIATRPARQGSVWGPMISNLANALGRAVDATTAADTALRLRQAGITHLTADGYRTRQLATTVAGLAFGMLLALALPFSPALGLLLVGLAGFVGLTRWRALVDRKVAQRRTTMRAETHTICHLLAVYLRTGDTPIGALERLGRRTRGAVPHELADAVARIRAGDPAAEVLEQAASSCPEPAAARLYRLLASSWRAGGDPDALFALGEDLRAARREEIERSMVKRRTMMTIPLVAVLGPIMLMFILAPLPSMIFG